MKKRIAMVAMAAMVLGLTFTGCQKDEENTEATKEPVTMEDVEALLDKGDPDDVTEAPEVPLYEGIEETVANMPETVATDIQTNGVVSQEKLFEMVQLAVTCTLDPCVDEGVTTEMSRISHYLIAMGGEKAADHALTKFGQEINTYIDLVAVKGKKTYDVEVENQLAVVDQIVADYFVDDAAIEAQVADFYQSVQ